MRLIAIILFVAALAKVGLVQHLQQAGARDVIVAAYAGQAVAACEKSDPTLKLSVTATSDIDMQIGDRARAVSLWQVDSPDWVGRYRQVYLLLKTTGSTKTCRFDVIHRVATSSGQSS